MQELFIGRQPIFDRNLNTVAYELLFRRGDVGAAGVVDGDQATCQVLLNAFVEIGLEQVAGDALVFINLTRALLLTEEMLPFPPGRAVFEVLEDIEPDEAVIAAVRRLAASGYTIALDDFLFREELRPLIDLARIIKIDIQLLDEAGLREHVRQLRQWPVKLLAEKVETHEEYDLCRELGFELFQGYFLSKPRVIKGQSLAPSKLATLRLLAELQNPDTDVDEVQRLISQDVGLSFRMLKLVNSAAFGLPKKVESLKQAVVFLGTRTIRNWATLLAAASSGDKPSEVITTALVRARMCQLLAEMGNRKRSEVDFTVGLFSALDALMDTPLGVILEQLPLSQEINGALLDFEGTAGEELACVMAYERWDWEVLNSFDFPAEGVHRAFMESVHWADEVTGSLLG